MFVKARWQEMKPLQNSGLKAEKTTIFDFLRYFHFRYDPATKPIECSRRGSLCVTYDYVEVRDGGYEASPLVGM